MDVPDCTCFPSFGYTIGLLGKNNLKFIGRSLCKAFLLLLLMINERYNMKDWQITYLFEDL